jgi:seryl-tRNA synthetase
MSADERLRAEKTFFDDLVAARLIVPSGVPGVFGRGAVFEDVVGRLGDLVTRWGAEDRAEKLAFPPTLSRQIFEKSEYLESFPHLAGTVWSFEGTDAQHLELKERIRDGKPWGDLQSMTDVVLAPSACYPVYPIFAGRLPEEGKVVDVQQWVFRHEPSEEPTRMQSFRMREYVRMGTPAEVVRWRGGWLDRGLALLVSLGLDARVEVASDPFFGRSGRMLVKNQKEAQLKFEVVVPLTSEEKPCALCSFNYHQDHFGRIFGIESADGNVAHTACLGFGMERVAMALFKTHGVNTGSWPDGVKKQLWAESLSSLTRPSAP